MARKAYPEDYNYAVDPAILKRAKEHCVEISRFARDNRATVDQEMMDNWYTWLCKTTTRYYAGRAQVFLPYTNRIEEKRIKELRRSMFPSDDYFAVKANPESPDFQHENEKAAKVFQAKARYDLETLNHLRSQIKLWLRMYHICGWIAVCYDWVDDEPRSRKRRVRASQALLTQVNDNPEQDWYGPEFRLVDPWSFFVWPETTPSVRRAHTVFEDLLFDKTLVQQGVNNGRYDEEQAKELFKIAKSGKGSSARFQKRREQLAARGITDPTDVRFKNIPCFELTRFHTLFPLESKKAEPEPSVMTLGEGEVILEIRKNLRYDPVPPYIFCAMYQTNESIYGRPYMFPSKTLQYMVNDTANQGLDGAALALNPIAAVDPMLVSDPDLLKVRPGAKWAVPPDSVKWDRPPNIFPEAAMVILQLKGVMEEASGSGGPGLFLPTPNRAGRKPGAAQQAMVIQGLQAEIQDEVEHLEENLLEPLLRADYILNEQFLDKGMAAHLIGKGLEEFVKEGRKLTREDLVGNFRYEWMGSTVIRNQQVATQQFIQVLPLLTGLPPDKQTGRHVDIYYFVETILRDAFGRKDVDKILVNPSQDSMDPEVEELVFAQGVGLDPSLSDNDQEHILAHRQHKDEGAPPVKMLREQHVAKHVMQMIAKQRMQQQQTAMQQAMAQRQPGALGPQRNRPPSSVQTEQGLVQMRPQGAVPTNGGEAAGEG